MARRTDVVGATGNRHRCWVRTIVFTGAAGAVATQVISSVVKRAQPDDVVILSQGWGHNLPSEFRRARIVDCDLATADLTELLAGVDAVVHLGTPVDGRDPCELLPARIVNEASVVLAAASRVGVPDVVVVSSALVLGALAANPVPLTEQAVVHPAHEFRPAVELAEIERVAAEYRGGVDRTLTVLRVAPVVAEGVPGWLAAELHWSLAYPVAEHDPGFQYLHAEDLGTAIASVLQSKPGGIVHAAPDGALSGPERRALETRPRLRVPGSVAAIAASVRSAARGSATPEGIRPYLAEEWLLANDKLRGLGWEPRFGNAEAYVAAFKAAPWSMIPSGRRQEFLLGGLGALAAGAAVGAGVLVRRRRR